MRNHIRFAAAAALGLTVASLSAVPARAQNESKDRPPLKYQFDQNAISQKIVGDTDDGVAEAVVEIKRLLAAPGATGGHATIALRWRWGDQFLKARRYEELLPLCKAGIFRMAHERPYHASGLQRMRVLCLLNLGRKQEALTHAKLYFNTCVTAEAAEAIRLLIRCLQEAHPGDDKIVERFKAEQIAGAELVNDPPAEETWGKSVLSQIPLPREDAADCQREIARRRHANVRQTGERVALGNFLLLAGRNEEARQVFEETFDGGPPDAAAADLLECVAIAIRACDGTIGRANAYILANQGETPKRR
jgi:tetratricopeptide (TPR) repeat protein